MPYDDEDLKLILAGKDLEPTKSTNDSNNIGLVEENRSKNPQK